SNGGHFGCNVSPGDPVCGHVEACVQCDHWHGTAVCPEGNNLREANDPVGATCTLTELPDTQLPPGRKRLRVSLGNGISTQAFYASAPPPPTPPGPLPPTPTPPSEPPPSQVQVLASNCTLGPLGFGRGAMRQEVTVKVSGPVGSFPYLQGDQFHVRSCS